MNRAQISLETLIAVSLLLIFFIAAALLLGQINSSVDIQKTQSVQWSECLRLAGIADEVFAQGKGIQITTTSAFDLNWGTHVLYVGQIQCNLSAIIQPASNSQGKLLIQNKTGVVVIQNV